MQFDFAIRNHNKNTSQMCVYRYNTCSRPEVRYLPRGSVLPDDAINCSNLASSNRRIHSRDVTARWEVALHTAKGRVRVRLSALLHTFFIGKNRYRHT